MTDHDYIAAQRAYDRQLPPEYDSDDGDDRPACDYCGHAAAHHFADGNGGCYAADNCRCRQYVHDDPRALARAQERDLWPDEYRRLVEC